MSFGEILGKSVAEGSNHPEVQGLTAISQQMRCTLLHVERAWTELATSIAHPLAVPLAPEATKRRGCSDYDDNPKLRRRALRAAPREPMTGEPVDNPIDSGVVILVTLAVRSWRAAASCTVSSRSPW